MRRLGYDRYVAQGGDVGAAVTDGMGRRHPRDCSASTRTCSCRRWAAAELRPKPRRKRPRPTRSARSGRPASATSSSSPPGRRRSATRLLDSPVALAAWMLDHDTDATTRSPAPSSTASHSGNLTRDHILDNITLYWLTGTGASAARSYWESGRASAHAPGSAAAGGRPVRLHDVPGRDLEDAAELGRGGYPNVIYFNEVDQGGHFAAWEEPELFSEELRAAFSRCAKRRDELVRRHNRRQPEGRGSVSGAPNLPAASPTRSRAGTSTPATCACTRSSAATARRCCWSMAGRRPGTRGGWSCRRWPRTSRSSRSTSAASGCPTSRATGTTSAPSPATSSR